MWICVSENWNSSIPENLIIDESYLKTPMLPAVYVRCIQISTFLATNIWFNKLYDYHSVRLLVICRLHFLNMQILLSCLSVENCSIGLRQNVLRYASNMKTIIDTTRRRRFWRDEREGWKRERERNREREKRER